MKRTGLLVALVAFGLTNQACSSSDSTGAGGSAGGAAGGAGGGLATGGAGGAGGSVSDCPAGVAVGLTQDGSSHLYVVTAVTVGDDGCGLQASTLVGVTFPVLYTPAAQKIAVGNGKGAPEVAGFGEGLIGCKGTLKRDNQVSDVDVKTCVWSENVESKFELIGVDKFTIDVTDIQSNFTAPCTGVPASGTCTSTFKLTFAKVVSGAGGAGGH